MTVIVRLVLGVWHAVLNEARKILFINRIDCRKILSLRVGIIVRREITAWIGEMLIWMRHDRGMDPCWHGTIPRRRSS